MAEQTGFPMPPEGLIIELVTPLTAAGELDGASLTRLVERAVVGADGLLAGGPGLGEGLELPLNTRRQLLSHLLPAVAGRVPLIFGITGHTWEETQQLARAVQDECSRQNYQGRIYLADLPLWYHRNRGLPQVYQGILDEAPLPLILLNLPAVVRRRAVPFKHLNIRTHVFKKLAALEGIVGLIYQGEMRRFLNYHHAAAAQASFAFYEADEANFMTRPGAWGVVSGGAQLFPAAWQRVVRACLHPEALEDDPQGRYEVWEHSRRFLQLAQLCRTAPVSLFKTALAAQGTLTCAATAPGAPQAEPDRQKRFLELAGAFGS